MQTDPIADFLTQIRNANMVHKESAEIPASRVKEAIAAVLAEEGYIERYKIKVRGKKRLIQIYLKYPSDENREKQRLINHLERVSRPGRRFYVKKDEIPQVRNGLGICILSTPKGILSGEKARRLGVGGEILCYIW